MRQKLARDILDLGHGYFAPEGATITLYSPVWSGGAGEAEFYISIQTDQTYTLRQGGGSYIDQSAPITLKVGLGDVVRDDA